MMIKKQTTKATNGGLVILVLLTMSAVFLCSCNKSQSNSPSSSEHINTKETTDDQNRKTDSNSTSTNKGEIEIYSGPGLDYCSEGKIDYTDISGFVLEDHGWIEIKYNKSQHGYVKSDFVEKEDLSEVPVLIDTIPSTVGGRKYLETVDFQYRLSGDIDLFEDTDDLNKISMIEKGNVVTVVAPMPLKGNDYQIVGVKGGTEQERSYWLIDAYTERGKERAYVGARDLFDLDNPLKDFSSVKENNLKLSLGDDVYYSSGDSDFFKDEWETIDEFNLTHTEVNYWEGFLSVITSSDISLEDIESPVVEGSKTKIPTLSKGKRTYTNTYTSLEAAGPISPTQLNALVWLGEKLLTFFSESKQTQSFNVSLQQCRGEKRLVIYTGVPIESMQNGRYYGKKFSLLELLLDKGYTLLTATDMVDENIRSLDPAFNGEKKYSMDIEFAKQEKDDSPYGMRIIIDKEGNAYGNIVLNKGTYFRVVYDNKVVRDLTKDIESALFQLDNNTTSILLDLLEQSGFEIIKRESIAAKEEKDEAANYDYSGISDEDLEQYLNNMEIPVDIYTYFHHYSDSKKVDINDPYTFWMMLSFYATMQMDDDMYPSGSRLAERYLDDKYGEMLILSEEEVRDAVNVMMPGIAEYPDYPNSQYLHYYEKDGNYYFPLIDLDTESARMTDIKINDDGTATATVEAFTYYTGEIYETYQISLEKNDNINVNSPEPYPYSIKSISVFDSQNNTTHEVTHQEETGYEDGEVPPKVVSCWENTAIITKQGDLLMCGHNDYDKLGYDGNDSWQFLKVKDNVRDVFVGASNREELAIITKDNKLLMWNYSYGDKGFIPVLDNVDSFVSSYYFSAGYTNAAVTKDGKLYMWGEFYSPDGIGKVESEEPKHIMNNVKQISINEESIGVVTMDGNLLVWGSNEHGQLGIGSTQDVTTSTNILSDISLVSIGKEHSVAIDKEGNLYTWGANRSGELADGSTYSNFYPTIVMTDVKKAVADEGTTYVVDNSGKLYSCGSNFQGALGLGAAYEDVQEVNKFTEIMSDVVDISAMNQTILVLTASGDVFGFGNNQYGQLGMGNTIEYTYPMHILNIDSYEAATSEERSADIDEAVITDDTKIDLSFSQDDQLINVTLTVPGLDYYRTGENFDIDVEFTDSYVVYKLDYDADDYGKMARLLVSNMPNGSSMTYTEKTSVQRTINGDSITWSFDATQAGINLDSIKYSGYGIWHIVGLSSRYDSYTDARFATYEHKGEELVQINDNNIIDYLYYSF